MPFTISHAAVVVPFTQTSRNYLSLTGLIIGSMVPDFLYFIFLNPYFNSGHQWWGIFVYDIPLSILLAYIYHMLVKPILVPFLPRWAGNRLLRYRWFNWNSYFRQHYVVVLISVVSGILTHFFLDAFTHEEGYFVLLSSFLRRNITVWQHPMKMWYLMQYLSSVAGLLLLFYFFLKTPAVNSARKLPIARKAGFWSIVIVVSGIILLINEQLHHINCRGLDYLATMLGGLFYGLLITVLGYRIYTSRSDR